MRNFLSVAKMASLVYERENCGGDADFRFVNGRCHFSQSIPSLVTKPFRMNDAVSALV